MVGQDDGFTSNRTLHLYRDFHHAVPLLGNIRHAPASRPATRDSRGPVVARWPGPGRLCETAKRPSEAGGVHELRRAAAVVA
ncbi:hypothetical protein ColLi_12144 [Colletotrichum liriopes]|uniref:Uncharacterized protein n=1 Tax=Colletotrichum liriopes TaxID=708192 RepID=A0AA37LZ73_9PEZI|nr:hypothetical protein ColLi_12144 [Colletotrichum liriopes]